MTALASSRRRADHPGPGRPAAPARRCRPAGVAPRGGASRLGSLDESADLFEGSGSESCKRIARGRCFTPCGRGWRRRAGTRAGSRTPTRCCRRWRAGHTSGFSAAAWVELSHAAQQTVRALAEDRTEQQISSMLVGLPPISRAREQEARHI